MKITKIAAGLAAAAVFALSAVSAGAEATEDAQPAGYVSFTAIKSTIGQGFTVEPVQVPFYEGENGLDVVKRAVDTQYSESDYGPFITGLADDGEDEVTLPDAIAEVVAETTGRTAEGYLSSMDYTAESGWTYFVNGEYAQVGIGDYTPADGDVLEFEFTVYGYGADLGVDNSSWGGAAALKEMPNKAKLIALCAAEPDATKDSFEFVAAMETLAIWESTQEDIDNAVEALSSDVRTEFPDDDEIANEPVDDAADTTDTTVPDKTAPDTGVEGMAVVLGAAVLACGALALAKRK